MAVYVIGYDLHPTQGETYGNLTAAIKQIGSWWHCLDSTWLVSTDRTAVQIRDALMQHMRSDDQLIVVRYAPHESAWVGFTGNCSDWLKANM